MVGAGMAFLEAAAAYSALVNLYLYLAAAKYAAASVGEGALHLKLAEPGTPGKGKRLPGLPAAIFPVSPYQVLERVSCMLNSRATSAIARGVCR